jgi:hypothetical protein
MKSAYFNGSMPTSAYLTGPYVTCDSVLHFATEGGFKILKRCVNNELANANMV